MRKTCCKRLFDPSTAGRSASQIADHLDARSAKRMRHQGERLFDDLVEIHFLEFGAAGAREIEEIIDDLAGAEGLLDDFVDQLMARIVGRQRLASICM